MAVDALRTHHSALARAYQNSDGVTWLRWYPCAPGAQPLGLWTWSGDPVWETFPEFVGPGIYDEPLIWRRKRYPAPPGLHYHGLPEWFENGLPESQYNFNPVDDSCTAPLIDPRGGAVAGGEADMKPLEKTVTLILEKTNVVLEGGTINNMPIGSGTCYRIQADAPVILTGLGDGINGRMIILENVGEHPVFCINQSTASLAPNRFLTIDQFSTRLTPTTGGWFQYDGTSQKWREISTVPIVRDKGDLLTHTLTTATRLPAPTDPGKILTTNPDTETGLEWADPSAVGKFGGDLNYYRQWGQHRYGIRHYYLSTYAALANNGPIALDGDRIKAVPFITPQRGKLEKLACYVSNAGNANDRIAVALYDSISENDLYPLERLAGPVEIDATTAGAKEVDFEVELENDRVYWLVTLEKTSNTTASWQGWTNVPHMSWPMLGYDVHAGWAGFPVGCLLNLSWSFATGLPLGFPAGALPSYGLTMVTVGVNYAEPE